MRTGARHLLTVTQGQTVATGEILGEVGSSGNSTMPHLHFEVQESGSTLDPFAGPCGPANTMWASQLPYQDDCYLSLSGITSSPLSIDLAKDPPAVPNTVYATDPVLDIWVQLINVQVGSQSRFEIYRPNGSLFWNFTFTHLGFCSQCWWWGTHTIPGFITTPGTWTTRYLSEFTSASGTHLCTCECWRFGLFNTHSVPTGAVVSAAAGQKGRGNEQRGCDTVLHARHSCGRPNRAAH